MRGTVCVIMFVNWRSGTLWIMYSHCCSADSSTLAGTANENASSAVMMPKQKLPLTQPTVSVQSCFDSSISP